MKLRIARSNSLADHKKVPLNTIILPPLSPPISEHGATLLGKVTVNKSKSGTVNGEIVTIRTPEIPARPLETAKGPDASRIAQLEQNIRFLQEQHQLMLTGLHNEIESLRNRNRELQFQLVFVKGNVPSTPSSPEDETRYKTYNSPKTFNITPLQVELLEKEMSDMKLQLQEAESRNIYLSAIVDEQKKKLDRYERDREKERERAGQPDPELLRKLDDAEVIIRRLRRENSDLRRESSAGASHYHMSGGGDRSPNQQREGASTYQSPRNGQNQGRGNHRHRGHNNHFRGNWFPPLHSQSYWQGGNKTTGGPQENTALPSLQPNEPNGGAQHYQSRRGHNNNHHYHNGENKKYRHNKRQDKTS